MAVGARFSDPDTQAAIAAQAGGQDTVNPTPEIEDTEDVKATEPVKKPDASEPPAKAQEPTQSDDVNLDMNDTGAQTPEEVDAELAKAGFKPEDLGKELAENDGELTEDTVKALKDKFGDEAVDAHIKDLSKRWQDSAKERDTAAAAEKGKVDEMNNYIFETLANGDAEKGKENLKTLSEWCRDNMPEGQLKSINTLLRSGDKDVVRSGLEQAVTAWRKGTEKPMMTGDAHVKEPTAQKLEPLSRDQYVQIVGSEKYNTDPEYAAKIDARRSATMKQESFVTPEFSASRPPIR